MFSQVAETGNPLQRPEILTNVGIVLTLAYAVPTKPAVSDVEDRTDEFPVDNVGINTASPEMVCWLGFAKVMLTWENHPAAGGVEGALTR